MSTTWRLLLDWGQENVEDHGNHQKDDVSHNAEPETWVFEELLVVGAEKDVADGHSSDDASEMGHERDLVLGGGQTAEFRVGSLNSESSWGRVSVESSDLMEMWLTPTKKSLENQFCQPEQTNGRVGVSAIQRGEGSGERPSLVQSSPSRLLLTLNPLPHCPPLSPLSN